MSELPASARDRQEQKWGARRNSLPQPTNRRRATCGRRSSAGSQEQSPSSPPADCCSRRKGGTTDRLRRRPQRRYSSHAARLDCACPESTARQTGGTVAIAHIQACATGARHDCFGSRGCSGVAMPLPRKRSPARTSAGRSMGDEGGAGSHSATSVPHECDRRTLPSGCLELGLGDGGILAGSTSGVWTAVGPPGVEPMPGQPAAPGVD